MERSRSRGKAYLVLAAALAIGVVALLILLYRGSRGEGEPSHAAAAPRADFVEEADALPPPRADRARPEPPPPPVEARPTPDSLADSGGVEEPEVAPPSSDSPTAFKNEQLARGRTELRRAAATCLQGGQSDRDEDLLIFQYVLVGTRGTVGPADLEVLQSNIGDPELDDCIIEQIRDVEWKADGPEIRVPVADSFTIGDLKKLSR